MVDPLHVMMSFTRPTETSNPYVQLLVRALQADGVVVHYLSWPRLLLAGRNILHIHWPETLLHRRTIQGRVANRIFVICLIVRARLGLTRIVRTVHNTVPHEEPSRVDRWLLQCLDRARHASIFLTPPSDSHAELSIVLPHAELGTWYSRELQRPITQATADVPDVLFFGLVRRYKGVEHILRIASAAPDLNIRIIGAPVDPELAASVASATHTSANLSSDLRHIPDADLVAEITTASLVILPYEKFENSGAAALAIDLGTPVLVPSCAPTIGLRELFSDRWVHLYEPPLTPDAVRLALSRAVQTGRDVRPVVEIREWPYQARAHKAVYESVRTH